MCRQISFSCNLWQDAVKMSSISYIIITLSILVHYIIVPFQQLKNDSICSLVNKVQNRLYWYLSQEWVWGKSRIVKGRHLWSGETSLVRGDNKLLVSEIRFQTRFNTRILKLITENTRTALLHDIPLINMNESIQSFQQLTT